MENEDIIVLYDYKVIKFVLQNPQSAKEILVETLKREIDSIEDTISDGYREDKTELELMKLRLKEIKNIKITDDEGELTEEQFQKFVEKYEKGVIIKKIKEK